MDVFVKSITFGRDNNLEIWVGLTQPYKIRSSYKHISRPSMNECGTPDYGNLIAVAQWISDRL
jgi:hypothetical protein